LFTPPVFLFDPEIIVPSAEAKDDFEFWIRLLAWSRDYRPRLGRRSLEGLLGLLKYPPPTRIITPAELHNIVGRLAARVHEPYAEDAGHDLCLHSWIRTYTPVLGDLKNPERLLEDLQMNPVGSRLVIAIDQRGWNIAPFVSCVSCRVMRVYQYTLDGHGAEVALRAEFLDQGPMGLDEVADQARTLFPNIVFSETAWNRIGTLRGDPQALVGALVHHLGVLSDHAVDIWTRRSQNDQRSSELGAHLVDASIEGGKTRGTVKFMRLRDFSFQGVVRRCEWHTKIEPNRNRIHFAVDQGKVFVGTIEEHLPTA